MSVLETLEICFSADLSGVTGQLEDLGARLKSLSAQSLQTAGMFSSAGAAMAENFARGLASGRSAVTAQGAATVSALAAALASGRTGAALEGASAAAGYASAVNGGVSGAKNAGRQLSAGLASGIRSGKSGVTSAVNHVVSAALSKMKSLLKIHSPSKVTRGLGAYFGEGFAGGIAQSASLALDAARTLGGAALDGLPGIPEADEGLTGRLRGAVDAAVQDALGGVEITIPLSVDGMKLGEASIRGINAVTKSAGRLLLNI